MSIDTYCTLFLPNKHFYMSHHFRSLWEFISAELQGQSLSLGTRPWCGPAVRIQHSDSHSLTSVSGQEPKSFFKPLEATQDHVDRAGKKKGFSGVRHPQEGTGLVWGLLPRAIS